MTKPPRRVRRRTTITAKQAMHRLAAMISKIEEDIRIALWAEAVLEAANKQLKPGQQGRGAGIYNTIAQSLALNLAISLSRLYDRGSKRYHPNQRDIASIPLIVRLLKQKRCQKRLVTQARHWTPQLLGMATNHAIGCQKDIDQAIASYAKIQTAKGRAILNRLKKFRDKRLAHSLMRDTLRRLPIYNDLFLLTDIARDVVQHAKLSIDGLDVGLQDTEEIIVEQAEAFWQKALPAALSD